MKIYMYIYIYDMCDHPEQKVETSGTSQSLLRNRHKQLTYLFFAPFLLNLLS